jgi:hypothetical protein
MAKPFLNQMGKHWRIGVILILIAFAILFLMGYHLGPDKTMQPPLGTDQQQ